MSADITNAFEAHAIDNTTFGHAEHVQVAYDLLRKYDFIDAAATYAKGIRSLAAKAGDPDKFNLTITYAFMSLIAERLANGQSDDFAAFSQENPDLMTKVVLNNWYKKERLNTALARRVFLLPVVA
ncbi:hypothetical protein RUESEDTHA_01169 [Ruegeria sp. THAF57]|uniref:hypothetical protein n=1 Tax=Ruegeria sp. THAF57 TaxID=2744555 RepID=UPI0015DE2A4B|nr:hypothetical protein [Ruegeria sp. THAF57]CAD0184290.1 hypothetical protein RUESEDTHA_01169 [Ruegeria sp. THAF57]